MPDRPGLGQRTGRLQAAVLERLAAAPEGLTCYDLADLTARYERLADRQDHASRALHSLAARRLAVRTGRLRQSNPDAAVRHGAPVWEITDAGRVFLRELAADRARQAGGDPRPAGWEAGRVARRAAVAAALADGMGPDTPAGVRGWRVRVMREAGCRVEDIALVFAVPEQVIKTILEGRP